VAVAKGLPVSGPPVGTVLVYATAPNDVAQDGKGRNGLFTKNLLNHISEPGRKLDELFQVVAQSVEQEAFKDYNRARQVPYRSYSFSGSFCLAGCEDPKVVAQIAQIKRESDEAEARVRALTEENTRLVQQAAERAASVSALETKIGALSKDASSAGTQSATVSTELAQLRTSLASARVAQLDAEKFKTEVTKRESEIESLRVQMAVLSGKANQLEEYRLRIDTLERENADKTRLTEQIDQVKRQSDEATKRVVSLTEENTRLRQQAQERSANVQALEVKISALTNETANYGAKSSTATTELANLRASLELARAAQQRADSQKDEAAAREREIYELKNQIAGFQNRSSQLEDMRKRIIALETENADKTQQLNNKEAAQAKTRPVLIPSF
jgi:chromosome segregation ATPase